MPTRPSLEARGMSRANGFRTNCIIKESIALADDIRGSDIRAVICVDCCLVTALPCDDILVDRAVEAKNINYYLRSLVEVNGI